MVYFKFSLRAVCHILSLDDTYRTTGEFKKNFFLYRGGDQKGTSSKKKQYFIVRYICFGIMCLFGVIDAGCIAEVAIKTVCFIFLK